jgi:DNA polymerase-3 subunit beta
MNAMNPVDAKGAALAMYETACESHQRRDWREACHALAAALKAQNPAPMIAAAVAEIVPPAAPKAPAIPTPQVAAMPGMSPLGVKAPAAKPAKAPVRSPLRYTMEAASLAKALKMASRAIDVRSARRTGMVILECVHLAAHGDHITMTATDLDNCIGIVIDAPGCGEWESVAVAAELAAVLKGAVGPVTLSSETAAKGKGQNTRLTVMAGALAVTLNVERAPTDFPLMVKPKAPWTAVAVSPAGWAEMRAMTGASVSTEGTRYYLNGAFVTVSPARTLDMVSTDGRRLHAASLPAPGMAPMNADKAGWKGEGFIIPRAALPIIDAIAAGEPGADLALDLCATHYQVTAGEVTARGKLIDASFPHYGRAIPAKVAKGEVRTVDAGALAAVIKRVTALGDKKAGSVKLSFGEGELWVSANTPDGADLRETLPYQGPAKALDVGFCARYLVEAMAALAGETVSLHMADPASPARLENPARPHVLLVLMPLRT